MPETVERMLGIYREGRLLSWSLRIAHLVTGFIIECLLRADSESVELMLSNLDHADPLDHEWLAVLRRRAPPGLVTIVASDVPPIEAPPEDTAGRSAAYVASDCTAVDPRLIDAYQAMSAEEREALHRERAEALQNLGEPSLLIGAIPLHREREGRDASALAAASRRCMHFSYYEAALDWAERACSLAERLADERSRNEALRDRIFALLMLGRLDEADALSQRCIAEIGNPRLRVHAYYALALLSIRLRPQRDHARGREYAEQAIAAAKAVPPSDDRTATLAFLHNTLALVTLREGDPDAALEMVTGAIETVRREAPDYFAEEAMILYHNRARLHLAAGRDEAALDDLDRLLALVPGTAEALADRAAIHVRARRIEQALADYGEALFWAPPQPSTLIARAGLLAEIGRWLDALADYDHALAIKPGDARIHCLKGLVALETAALAEAEAAFDAAIACAPDLADAWANRAIVHWRRGAFDRSLADLDRAQQLRDDPAIRRNREKMFAALARQS